MRTKQHKRTTSPNSQYEHFDLIDGTHPWMQAVPDAMVPYKVRVLQKGTVNYFNFDLAKEMGLIDQNHPHKMNKELEKKILETFNIQIINEYDIENRKKIQKKHIKKHQHMATRYLQLQHPSRNGKTSGDGRSIWNGYIEHAGKTWDINSRGTGVTKLAPGSVLAQKNLKTGDESIGYSCGLLELDEVYGAILISEIFDKHKINTERVLTVIETGKNLGIGVRAAPNLFRPAHLFSLIKQNDIKNLKKAVDFIIERQNKNGEWPFAFNNKKKYDLALEQICNSFAKFTARLEADYIFAWFTWDGDNVLINAGIIDYGSIRQFGLRHDNYRFDDVDRFSTTLTEQKSQIKEMLQVFAQIMDSTKTGIKNNLEMFKNHPILKSFDEQFEYYNLRYRLYNVGFSKNDQEFLVKYFKPDVENFIRLFSYFEKFKTSKKLAKVDDGVNKPAIFNMRNILRELPKLLMEVENSGVIDPQILFDIMLASTAGKQDKKMTRSQHKKLLEFQDSYKRLIQVSKRYRSSSRMLRDINQRSEIINRSDRFTGNAITLCADEILESTRKGMPRSEIQNIIDNFVKTQVLLPKEGMTNPDEVLKRKSKTSKKVLKQLLSIVRECKDEI